jgi:hypothetical protein
MILSEKALIINIRNKSLSVRLKFEEEYILEYL